MSRHVGGSIQQNLGHMYHDIATLKGPSVGGLSPTLSMQYSLIKHQLYRHWFVDIVVVVVVVVVAAADSIIGSTPVGAIDEDALQDFSVAFHEKVSFVGVIQHFRHPHCCSVRVYGGRTVVQPE
jgi:hypothetical protein